MENNFKLWHTSGMSESNIGQLIRVRRKAAKMTQQDLADAIQRTNRSISDWERGASLPGRVSIQRLARAFQMETDDLLSHLSDAELAKIDTIIEETPPSALDIILEDIRIEEDRRPDIVRALEDWLAGWRARGG
jgi:transcriptional regulator with XRE-family HTH domain